MLGHFPAGESPRRKARAPLVTFPCLIIRLPETPAVSHVYGLQMPLEALPARLCCHPCSHPNPCCALLWTLWVILNVGYPFHSWRDTVWCCDPTSHADYGAGGRPHSSRGLRGRWASPLLTRITGQVGGRAPPRELDCMYAIVKTCRCWSE